MSEMIERVAQAICGDDNPENILAIHRTRARAAIEAMREPTEAMLAPEVVSRTEARLDGTYPVNYLLPIMDIWPKMIDAALSGKQVK